MNQPSSNEKPRHGCIIMASGKGERFGSNKLMARLNGKPLIQYAIEASNGLFTHRTVVTRSREVANLCRALEVHVVLHAEPNRNDTVALGMKEIEGCTTATFLQGDQPLIGTKSIDTLLRASERDCASIWRASFKGVAGSPVLFPSWAFDELRELPCGKGGNFVAKAHSEKVHTVEVSSKWELFDVDTRDDLRLLAEKTAQSGITHRLGSAFDSAQ